MNIPAITDTIGQHLSAIQSPVIQRVTSYALIALANDIAAREDEINEMIDTAQDEQSEEEKGKDLKIKLPFSITWNTTANVVDTLLSLTVVRKSKHTIEIGNPNQLDLPIINQLDK
jgi:hypothetical protein